MGSLFILPAGTNKACFAILIGCCLKDIIALVNVMEQDPKSKRFFLELEQK